MDFTGKTTFITGAADGIGKATAIAFGRKSANVVLLDIDGDRAHATANEIDSSGARTMVSVTDVADTVGVRAALHAAKDRFGSLDVVVNNAAIYPRKATLEVTEDFWDELMAINVRGLFFCAQEAMRIMLEQGSGSIVNVSSGAGWDAHVGQLVYCTSKAALTGINRGLALETARSGVRVNIVSPGHTLCEHTIETIETVGGTTVEAMAATLPSGRFQTPEETANTIVWVSSDEASGITGAVLSVNGASQMF